MSDDIPYRPRPRDSMDTLSTLDTPTPPYGLVDPTYRPGSIRSLPLRSGDERPGSIRSIPVPSSDERPPSPMRSGYRIRVGKLELRCTDKSRVWPVEVQILELDAVDQTLSPELTAVIALFEDVIKRGYTILSLLEPFYDILEGVPEVDILYHRLRTLWSLCITIGAALCEYEGTVRQLEIDWFSKSMPWICDSLLQDALEKVQQMGLSDAIRAARGELPAPTAQQRKVVESWVGDMNKTHGKKIDLVTCCFTEFNLSLQLKSFEE